MTDLTPDTYVSLTRTDGVVLHYGPFVAGGLLLSLTVKDMGKHGEIIIRQNPSIEVLADLEY